MKHLFGVVTILFISLQILAQVSEKRLALVIGNAAYQYSGELRNPVNDTIIDCESTSDNDAFLNNGYPAFLVLENSLPDFWEANSYFHKSDDATDRLANDSGSPSGVTYDFAFATDVTRAVVAFITQKAVLVQ